MHTCKWDGGVTGIWSVWKSFLPEENLGRQLFLKQFLAPLSTGHSCTTRSSECKGIYDWHSYELSKAFRNKEALTHAWAKPRGRTRIERRQLPLPYYIWRIQKCARCLHCVWMNICVSSNFYAHSLITVRSSLTLELSVVFIHSVGFLALMVKI